MKNIIIKKTLSLTFMSLLFVQGLYVALEPAVVTAAVASDNVIVTLNVDAGISITDGANSLMAPNMGILNNSAIGSSSWNVKTNSATGYTLAVKASTSAALKNGAIDQFIDYTPLGAVPDTWGGIVSGNKEFGFSGYGTDVLTSKWGTQSNCGAAGVPDVAGKYFGFSTSDYTLATRATLTTTAGITTNICFAAQQVGTYAASGTYTATITATATTI